MLPKKDPTTTTAWKKLKDYFESFKEKEIKELFNKDSIISYF